MSIEAFNLVANFWYNLFGSGAIFALVISAVFILILLSYKADLTVMLLVLIPLFIGFALSEQTTSLVEIPYWLPVILFVIGGAIFAYVFISINSK